jgi:hypothetical protein
MVLSLLLLLSAISPSLDLPPSLEGRWEAIPLVKIGAKAPGTPGEFTEFEDTYATGNAFVFYARYGPRNGDEGLFSWKNGTVSAIPMKGPDGRNISVQPDRVYAGKGLVYLSSVMPDHVYGWDGDKMNCIACSGQELEYGGIRHTLKRAWILDASADGKVLLYWDAPKQNANGWAIHDGTTLKAIWKEGDELPGMPGVRIKNLSSGRGCVFGCVPMPKLLEDGSVLGVMEVTGAPYKKAVFRLSAGKAEKVLAEKETPLLKGFRPDLNNLLAADQDSFVMDASSTFQSSTPSSITFYRVLKLLFYHKGVYTLESTAGIEEFMKAAEAGRGFFSETEAAYDRVLMPAPGQARAVVSILVRNGKQNWKQRFTGKVTLRDFPGLYYWNGEKLSRVPWEEAAGLTVSQAIELLAKTNVKPTAAAERIRGIDLRPMAKPAAGLAVHLPPEIPKGSWMIPVDSIDGKLVPPPKFDVEGLEVNLADVLFWENANEAVVRVPEGYYLLRRK